MGGTLGEDIRRREKQSAVSPRNEIAETETTTFAHGRGAYCFNGSGFLIGRRRGTMDVLPVMALLTDTAKHVAGIVLKAAPEADNASKQKAALQLTKVIEQLEVTLQILRNDGKREAARTVHPGSPAARVPKAPVLPWTLGG
jgi:hypothetical protein